MAEYGQDSLHGAKEKICFLVNGQYPAPTIYADWGDRLAITVKNSMPHNGTSIHWHGIRQLNTCTEDGVNGITECPVAPFDTKTYYFQATQFGTSWYHSHYSAQYGDGIIGAIVINGPAASNYDIDLGPYMINDWFYRTSYEINSIVAQNLQRRTGPPPADTLLINGKNKSPSGTGSYTTNVVYPGKKYRLRLINPSVDNSIRVSLDGHPFTVINADFVSIKPYTTNWVLLSVGQRYDVIFTANQAVGNYWFRAEVASDCASSNNFYGRSIFRYSGAPESDPTTTATSFTAGCRDPTTLTPWVSNTVNSEAFLNQVGNLQVDLAREQITTNGQNIVVWGVNMTAIDIMWDKPTLDYVKKGDSDYPRTYNLLEIPNQNTWSYWIIQETPGTPVPIPHPIHLHGHDFYVLGSGVGVFDKVNSVPSLKFQNPTRRDTAILPGGGWLAIAFPTDNPGAWLMHCHIAWHIAEGLGVQFLESKVAITLPNAEWEKMCTNWRNYYNNNPAYLQDDSGL
ncbi:laccase, multicopper oxidase, benzenediol:oxygen oxidorectuctase [Coniosporium apollinis]|uniref:laccase n=1 Tax=Coniosporium apollinis TaxID=61459 RepID=A0ABQ9NL27_9PEZI|nr:laccase, multicopper oxidase, benzenediol:oxygen oxidorectuctase [Coniosporium apollinis]